MTSSIKLEVRLEDGTPNKWCVPLTEEVFQSLMLKGSQTVHKVFGDGSLFSPLLFGKYFDPSDAFPLWEFESDVLLSRLRSSSQSGVGWFQTDTEYVLKSELQLPGVGKSSVQIYVENGKIMEISGQWRAQKEPKTNDWRSGHWWEHGFVRRLELPESADWRNIEAHITGDIFLEVRIPKNSLDCDGPQGNDGMKKDSDSV